VALRFVDTCRLIVNSFDQQAAGEIQDIWNAIDEGKGPKAMTTKKEDVPAEPTRRSPKGLAAWRDVIAPHPDVQSGRYLQAEFAADLAQVVAGTAEAEYQDPREFFRRTYVTPDMARLLRNALERLTGRGGEPVIDLKTAFGGGKTHTLLALYHLVRAGERVADLPDIRRLLEDTGLESIPSACVAALVGTALSPTKAIRELDDLHVPVNTLWGEMAYQLGGSQAFRIIQEDDARGTAPGSADLAKVFKKVGPCVILIDELVAFLRNISGVKNLAAGDYNKNISFLQNLTEAVRQTPTTILVVSIPESRVEYGDESGARIANQVEHIIGRLSQPWQPVGALEAFEVVRRRLFQELQDEASRNETCEEFGRMYRNHPSDFPAECREPRYVERIKSSYPIHPEIFDRLYEDWSTLERFQRTRGVLRLMASAIHELWRTGDKAPLVLPGSVPIYASPVRTELTRYLGEQWNSVIDTDVDGDDSEPSRVDQENERFGRVQAARRITRTIFLGSVPAKTTKGIEDVRIKLGVVLPGESIATYGDALGRLQQRLSHLYTTGQGRFWFDVPPNLVFTVRDRSSKIADDEVFTELERRLRQVRERGEFAGVHTCPQNSGEVPDEAEARLVILSPRTPHKRGTNDGASDAIKAAQQILDQRGTVPRKYRNMLLFAAADEDAVTNLLPEVRRYLAWKSIVADATVLNLDRPQEKQARDSEESADKTVAAQLDAAYKWALVPTQEGTQPLKWEALPLDTGLASIGSIPQRVSHRLQTDEHLISAWSPTHLRRELDKYLWKEGQPHVGVKPLWEEYLARYCYFPRLRDKDVLLSTIKAGVVSRDFFGYATGVREDGSYEGLSFGVPAPGVYYDDTSVLVRPEVAAKQSERVEEEEEEQREETKKAPPPSKIAKRFYGTVRLDPLRLGTSAGRIGDEIVRHLQSQVGSEVEVILELHAKLKDGAPEHVIRTVLENARSLKFENFGFEDE
jgi:predicted AAA+ superfamily ATPase